MELLAACHHPVEPPPAPGLPVARASTTEQSVEPAVTRLGTARWRLDDSVQAIAFTPDGTTVVAASQEGGVVVLDRRTGQRRVHVPRVDESIREMVLLDEGRTIAVAGAGGVARYSAATGDALPVLLAEDHTITAMAADPTGAHVAVTRSKGLVRVLEVSTGTVVARFGAGSSPRDLAFVSGTPWIAVAQADRVGLWDWRTGQRQHQLPTSQNGEFGVAADGSWIAVVGHGRGWEVEVWSLVDGRRLATLEVQGTGTIASSSDGRSLLINEGEAISVWDVASGRRVRRLVPTSSYARTIALSPDGTTVAAGGNDNAVGLWRLASGARLNENFGHRGRVHSLGFSPDGRALFTTSLGDRTALMWSVDQTEPLLAVPGVHAALDSTGQRLFAARSTGTDVEAFRAQSLAEHEPLEWTSSLGLIRGMRVQPDGQLAVAEAGRLSVVPPGASAPTWSSEPMGDDDIGDAEVGFSPDGTTAVLYDGETWMTVDIARRTTSARSGLECRFVHAAAVSSDGEAVVTGDDARVVSLWRAGTQIATVEADANIRAVAIDGPASLVAYATPSTVVLWDPVHAQRWHYERFRPSVLAYSPGADRLAIGFENGTVELWNRAAMLRTVAPQPAPAADLQHVCDDDEGTGLFRSGFISTMGANDDSLYQGMFVAPSRTE